MRVLMVLAILVTVMGCSTHWNAQAAKTADPKSAMPATPSLDVPQVWYYALTNLGRQDVLASLIDTVKRAKASGCNGVFVVDSKFDKLHLMDDAYKANVAAFRKVCREEGLLVAVPVCPYGHCEVFLSHDRDLAEGFPVRNAPFTVQDGKLVPLCEARIVNGDFSRIEDGRIVGWEIGSGMAPDPDVQFDGKPSLRLDDTTDVGAGRITQTIKVQPWQYYHVSIAVKTQDFLGKDHRLQALGADGYVLNWQPSPIEKTADWKRIDTAFNSLNNTEIRLTIGRWTGAAGGRIWYADARIEAGGFVNVIRRDTLPLKIASDDGETIYQEGRDFARVEDPKYLIDPKPGYFTLWHQPPEIKVLHDSRLIEGQRLSASYHFTTSVGGASQLNVCMAEPKVLDEVRKTIQWMKENFDPDVYFMGFDEMRCCGWDDSCVKTGKTPGQLLADAARDVTAMIKEVEPGKAIATWSRMFDPNQQASPTPKQYYLARGRGAWSRSWEGLSKDVMVFTWRTDTSAESLKWFDDRGHRQVQILFSAQDANGTKEWLGMAKGKSRVVGRLVWNVGTDFSKAEQMIKARGE